MALDLQNIELLEAHRTEAEDLLIGQGSRHGCGEVDRLSCSISSAQYDEILGHLNGPDVGRPSGCSKGAPVYSLFPRIANLVLRAHV